MTYARKIAKSEFQDASSRSARVGSQPTSGSARRKDETTKAIRCALHATIDTQRALARMIPNQSAAKRDDKEKREKRAELFCRKAFAYASRVVSETRALDPIAYPIANGIVARFARTSYAKRPAMVARALRFCDSKSLDLTRAVIARVILAEDNGFNGARLDNGNAIRVSLYRIAFDCYQAIYGVHFAGKGARAVSVGNSTRGPIVENRIEESRASFDAPAISRAEINRRAEIVGDSGSIVSNALNAKRNAESLRAILRAKSARGESKAHNQSSQIDSRKARADRPKVFQSVSVPAAIGNDGSLIRAPYIVHEWVEATVSPYAPMYDHAGNLIF